jgi:hypothetical protein
LHQIRDSRYNGIPLGADAFDEVDLVVSLTDAPVLLEAVLTTAELASRPCRPPDFGIVNTAFRSLVEAQPKSAERILQKFVELLLPLCDAHSAGVSILEEQDGRKFFRWHALAGIYAPYRWGSMPRDASPCGVVLDTRAVQLFNYPERHFPYTIPLNPPICEALLAPFRIKRKVIGTAWMIAHDESRRFDAEDLRRLEGLLSLTTTSYDLAALGHTKAVDI